MRDIFINDLAHLNDMFVEMGNNAQQVIRWAIESLQYQDIEKANKAIELDDVVDRLDYEIENKCLSLIALQQPIAKDLRRLGTLLKVITDMERIGDYGVNIAKITLTIKNEKMTIPLTEIIKMSELVEDMISKSMDSFLKENVQLAKLISVMDDKVDDMFTSICDNLIEIISQNASVSKEATNLLFVARHLERTADHITNICERIIYMVTGELIEIN